jgi:hypothetical protein
MPVVRRARLRLIVRRVVYATGSSALIVVGAGCGADRPADATPGRRLAAAVLSEDDMPAGYLPAENAAMFRGMRPAEPTCRRLFALADAPALGAGPRADTAFYQVDPGGMVAEHLLLAPAVPAHAFLLGVRRAAAGCDRVTMRTDSYVMRLRRAPLPVHGVGEESYTVRYAGWAGVRHRFHLDIVTARLADRLLVLVNETLSAPRTARDVAVRIAERAAAKLGGPASIG